MPQAGNKFYLIYGIIIKYCLLLFRWVHYDDIFNACAQIKDVLSDFTLTSTLQEKTGRTSVPQIFFNETYVGGNDDLQAVIKDEEAWNKLLADIQTNQPKEGSLLIPHPSEATDVVGECYTLHTSHRLLYIRMRFPFTFSSASTCVSSTLI